MDLFAECSLHVVGYGAVYCLYLLIIYPISRYFTFPFVFDFDSFQGIVLITIILIFK